jgi:hypothetical protein
MGPKILHSMLQPLVRRKYSITVIANYRPEPDMYNMENFPETHSKKTKLIEAWCKQESKSIHKLLEGKSKNTRPKDVDVFFN